VRRTRPSGPSEGDRGRARSSGATGTLHLVATPIGNLEDVTLRALRVLGEADLVLAEDTRRTRILLDRHAVKARPVSLHAHNEAARTERALSVLDGGGDVALVSDAGTPLVSDPGERLVAAAIAAGHEVVAVPGPSAVLAALAVSGLPVERFSFLGFLPRRSGARDALLESLRERPDTLVLFESPNRLAASLRRLAAFLGDDRPAAVARELTKRHEEVARGSLAELARRFADGAKGEVTIVVAGAPPAAAPAIEDLDAEIRSQIDQGRPSREIAGELARATGLPRREVYERVVALKSRR
jgi:16S rRNA (cytidine1402-2'-O)-methyltransferase